MKHPIFRFLPAIIFLVVAAMALIRDKDLVEAGIWSFFGLAMLVPVLPLMARKPVKRLVSVLFMILGLILLLLRLSGVLPVPVKPLPEVNSGFVQQPVRP